MSSIHILGRQVRFELRSFWRNRGAVVGTFLFPLLFLAIFGSIFKGNKIPTRGNISYLTFFVPGVLAFAIIASTFMVLANSFVNLRESGTLKRMRGTPLPTSLYLAGRIGATVVNTIALSVFTLIVGVGVYNVNFRVDTAGGLLVAIVLGTFCFCATGMAVTVIIPNFEAAPAVTNLLIMPIMMVSNVFFPLDTGPSFLKVVPKLFPPYHLANALQYAFHPATRAIGISAIDLVALAAWGIVGLFVAVRFFRWDPRMA